LWLDDPDDQKYVVCQCGWLPTLGDHYRVIHPDPEREQPIKDKMPTFQAMARGYAFGVDDVAANQGGDAFWEIGGVLDGPLGLLDVFPLEWVEDQSGEAR
jgi:hypothetical protein